MSWPLEIFFRIVQYQDFTRTKYSLSKDDQKSQTNSEMYITLAGADAIRDTRVAVHAIEDNGKGGTYMYTHRHNSIPHVLFNQGILLLHMYKTNYCIVQYHFIVK